MEIAAPQGEETAYHSGVSGVSGAGGVSGVRGVRASFFPAYAGANEAKRGLHREIGALQSVPRAISEGKTPQFAFLTTLPGFWTGGLLTGCTGGIHAARGRVPHPFDPPRRKTRQSQNPAALCIRARLQLCR